MQSRGIAYDPKRHAIIIPHYDINNNLIGIRKRTLVEEEEVFGKYRPATFNGKMYNHPLGFNLYNLNKLSAKVSVADNLIFTNNPKVLENVNEIEFNMLE